MCMGFFGTEMVHAGEPAGAPVHSPRAAEYCAVRLSLQCGLSPTRTARTTRVLCQAVPIPAHASSTLLHRWQGGTLRSCCTDARLRPTRTVPCPPSLPGFSRFAPEPLSHYFLRIAMHRGGDGHDFLDDGYGGLLTRWAAAFGCVPGVCIRVDTFRDSRAVGQRMPPAGVALPCPRPALRRTPCMREAQVRAHPREHTRALLQVPTHGGAFAAACVQQRR